jgi:hypothetical protein
MVFIFPGYWIRNVWVLLGTAWGTNGNFVTDSKCQWVFFGVQFCDVVKVEDLAEYWLQGKYESKLFKKAFYIFGYLLISTM